MSATVSIFLYFGLTSLIAARDYQRPSSEDTASLSGDDAAEGIDEAGLALFWLFVGLTGASIMCSVLVLCLRHCILRLLPPRPTRPDSSTTSTNSRAAVSQAALHRVNSSAEKDNQSHPHEAEFLGAVEVHQPGGSVVVGFPLQQAP